MNRSTVTVAATTGLAIAFAVSACSQSGQQTASSATPTTTQASTTTTGHSQADITFATDMIPHHAQAIQMADMALANATSDQIKKLAADIKAAQDPEIRTMSAWLTSWGQPMPGTMGGHDMDSMGSTQDHGGMMSSQQMDDLAKATGASFDRMWLQMMIQHHQGAVTMAQTELTAGSKPEAKKLAQAIIDSQTKEIDQMNSMLTNLKS